MQLDRRTNRVKVTASALLVLALTAGCGGIPKETRPEVESSYVSVPVPVEAPTPASGREADLLLRDFFTASAYPAEDYSAARAFLSEDAAGDWNPNGAIEVLQNLNLSTERSGEEEVEYRVTGDIVGSVSREGIFEAKFESYDETYRLVRSSKHGDWRVDGLPANVVIDRSGLASAYRPYDLFFVDAKRERLVADRRWTSTQEKSRAQNFLDMLIAGPRPGLLNGDGENLLEGASVSVERDTDTLWVDFSGLGQLSQLSREELAAEVVWTLAKAEIRGPYSIYVDGEPLLGEDSQQVSHQSQSLLRWDPDATVEQPFRVLSDGELYDASPDVYPPQRIDEKLADGASILYAASAPTGNHVAIVSETDGSRMALSIGEVGKKPTQVVTGETLSRPTWGTVDGNSSTVYSVIDGEKLLRITYDVESDDLVSADTQAFRDLATLPAAAQDTTEEPKVSVFRVSPDGAHALALIEGELYIVSMAALVDKDSRNVFTHIGHQFDDTAVSATWKDNSTILVGTSSPEYPLWQIAVDGSEATVLPSSGLETPIVDLATLDDVIYATDARAMMRLNQSDSDNRFWREVAAFQSKRGVPIFGN